MIDYSQVIPDEEWVVLKQAGYGRKSNPGKRPALLMVDVTYNFVGDSPEPMLESIKRFRNSCGEVGWKAIPHMQDILAASRRSHIPIFYTTRGYRKNRVGAGSWSWKNRRTLEQSTEADNIGDEIVVEVAPGPDDMVIFKDKPSAFFGTPLTGYLVELGIDTVIECSRKLG